MTTHDGQGMLKGVSAHTVKIVVRKGETLDSALRRYSEEAGKQQRNNL